MITPKNFPYPDDPSRNGEKIVFFPSGITKEKTSFSDGKRHGNSCFYDSLGRKKSCVNYKNGLKDE